MVFAALLTDEQFRYLVDNGPALIMAVGTTFAAVMGWRNAAAIGQVRSGVEDAKTEAARASELTVTTADALARKTDQAQTAILSRVEDVHQTLSDPLRSSSGVFPVPVQVTNTPAHPVPTAPGAPPAAPKAPKP